MPVDVDTGDCILNLLLDSPHAEVKAARVALFGGHQY